MIEYTVIRSNRRTLGLQIYPDGKVVVRAPYRLSYRDIQLFVNSKRSWIEAKTEEINKKKKSQEQTDKLTLQDLNELADKAVKVIPERVKYYADKIGVTYGRITIRNQKTRWGSCSSKGNLNFNCLLMLTPPEVIDSVVVHELCHRKEMNHSKRFYEEVLRVYPDYWRCHDWLKEHGSEIMSRMI